MIEPYEVANISFSLTKMMVSYFPLKCKLFLSSLEKLGNVSNTVHGNTWKVIVV